MKQNIEIPLSKNKLILGLVGSAIFVVLGIWLVINVNDFQYNSLQLLRNPIFVKTAGVLAIVVFGVTGVYGVKKMSDKKPGLIIDNFGITDNTNASSIGLIEWDDITDISTKQIMSSKFLLIHVKNPEKYIEKVTSKFKANIMRANMKAYGTPLSITSSTLKYDFKKLEELVKNEFYQRVN